jgi:excisionase family DNA binding protein
LGNFIEGKYGVILRIVHGYLIASSPEFGITVTKKFDQIRKSEEIGKLYLDVLAKVSDEIKRRTQTGKPIPEPKKIIDLLPKSDAPTLTVADVARMLETSQDTVRRLVEDESLTCTLTRGGHRRFRPSEIEKYINSSYENLSSPTEMSDFSSGKELDNF